jgi:hypothetical protein
MTRWLLLVTGFLFFTVTSCGLSGGNSEDIAAIRSHVDRSFDALARGDLVELGTVAPEFQEFDESVLRRMSENFATGISWSIDEVKIKGNTARVTVVFSGTDETARSELAVNMVQLSGEWRFGDTVVHEQRYDFVPIE